MGELARAARALAGGTVLLLGAACGARARPNVLLLVMDTTRADRCSFLGYPRPTTPRLAEFAGDATSFAQAWSPANWTGPSHASLFTGVSPERHGFHRGSHPFLPADRPVLSEAFSKAGYDTACFTNNQSVCPELGLTRGFATLDLLYQREDRPQPWARETHERAAAWAESVHAAGKPFFLFVNDMEPHLPYAPATDLEPQFLPQGARPEEIAETRAFQFPHSAAYVAGAEEIDARKLGLLSDLYDAEIATLDREIGVLLDRLRRDGLLDTTVVVIVGDHGEHLGEHHLLEHSLGLYAPLLHVPLLVRYPGSFAGGRRIEDVVRLEDVAPTLLELCGIELFSELDGKSLTRELPGRIARGMQPAHDWWIQRVAELYPDRDLTSAERGITSVFDGSRHLLEFSDGSVELYDPVHDPREDHDLASTESANVARLRAPRR